MTGKRILVIEDEYLIALDIETELNNAGFVDVTLAATEEEALVRIGEGKWDAAVADAHLHGRHITSIAAALNRCGIPYVVVTGYGRAVLPAETAKAPILIKPIQGRRLAKEVVALCGGSEPGERDPLMNRL